MRTFELMAAVLAVAITGTAGAQELQWATSAGGTRTDSGSDVATTPRGESYVTGHINGNPAFSSPLQGDIFVARYDRNGTLLWSKSAGGTGWDQGFGIATTPTGESYVTGRFSGTAIFGPGELNETELTAAARSDIFVAKYDRDGTLLWATRAGGIEDDVALEIATTPNGESYATGIFSGTAIFGLGEANETVLTSAGSWDLFLAKYDRDGAVVWATHAGGDSSTEGFGISTTPRGESYVTGRFRGTAIFGAGELNETKLVAGPPGSNYNLFLAKYDRDGAVVWATHAGGGNSSTQGSGIATTPRGESYVAGFFGGTAIFGPGGVDEIQLTAAGASDAFLAKYDQDGAVLWVTGAGGAGSASNLGIATTPRGESYVVGYFYGTAIFGIGESNETELVATLGSTDEGIPTDIFVAKYDRDGTLLWATRAGGTSRDVGNGIATTPGGDGYVTGNFGGTVTFGADEANATVLEAAGPADVFVAKYHR